MVEEPRPVAATRPVPVGPPAKVSAVPIGRRPRRLYQGDRPQVVVLRETIAVGRPRPSQVGRPRPRDAVARPVVGVVAVPVLRLRPAVGVAPVLVVVGQPTLGVAVRPTLAGAALARGAAPADVAARVAPRRVAVEVGPRRGRPFRPGKVAGADKGVAVGALASVAGPEELPFPYGHLEELSQRR